VRRPHVRLEIDGATHGREFYLIGEKAGSPRYPGKERTLALAREHLGIAQLPDFCCD